MEHTADNFLFPLCLCGGLGLLAALTGSVFFCFAPGPLSCRIISSPRIMVTVRRPGIGGRRIFLRGCTGGAGATSTAVGAGRDGACGIVADKSCFGSSFAAGSAGRAPRGGGPPGSGLFAAPGGGPRGGRGLRAPPGGLGPRGGGTGPLPRGGGGPLPGGPLPGGPARS